MLFWNSLVFWEEGMANNSNILTKRIPWLVWKGRQWEHTIYQTRDIGFFSSMAKVSSIKQPKRLLRSQVKYTVWVCNSILGTDDLLWLYRWLSEITCLGSLSLWSSWNGWAGAEREKDFALLPCSLSQCFPQHTFVHRPPTPGCFMGIHWPLW